MVEQRIIVHFSGADLVGLDAESFETICSGSREGRADKSHAETFDVSFEFKLFFVRERRLIHDFVNGYRCVAGNN